MIKLDLKSINLYDIDFEKFTPEIPDNFHRWIDLDIGIEGEQGSSIFSLCICSPKWISHHCNKEGFFWSNALILEQFDHKIIKSEIDKILGRVPNLNKPKRARDLCKIPQNPLNSHQDI
ncbi:hypothetical protein HHC16_10760 [Neisseria meningitidis]|uniref:immunity 8 family protein n=1 Tax=Neisseria meningitidis TaxID=487 RepID=UPI001EB62F1A|nr:immunity 8 family protein [Neisseria meningitidis]MBW3888913.1 hypothetical protein [Neisseria meningitidis]